MISLRVAKAEHVIVWAERDDLLLDSTQPTYPELNKDVETDVLVVGGGIAGLHIAYELLSSGVKRVTVVEDGSEHDGYGSIVPMLNIWQRSPRVRQGEQLVIYQLTMSTTTSWSAHSLHLL